MTSGGKTEGKSIGIPIPKFTFIPFFTYLAALFIIFNLLFSPADLVPLESDFFLLTTSFYIFFYDHLHAGSNLYILSTKTAGTCTSFGSIYPYYTIY